MTATEGAVFAGDPTNVVGRFVDANPFVTAANFNGPFATQTVISWGDGKSSVGLIAPDPLLAGVFDVIGTHIYAAPTPVGLTNTISIAVQDQWGGKTTITNNVVVGAATLTFTGLALPLNPAAPIFARMAFTSDVSLFTSANLAAVVGEYTASISWGDGSAIDAGSIKEDGTGIFHISGTHTYGLPGVYIIDVAVLVTGGAIFIDPTTATVSAPPQPMMLNVKPLVGGDFITAAVPFTTQVAEFETNVSYATASNFTATIDWGDMPTGGTGDDTTAGTIIQGADDPSTGDPTFYVVGSHQYDEANTFTFSVAVSSPGYTTISGTNTAIAYAPTLITQPAPISGVQGVALPPTVVATFTDPEFIANPSSFASLTTGVVTWGDGGGETIHATYVGTSPVGVDFEFIDSHTYPVTISPQRGYQATVTINTPDGSAAVVTDPVWVVYPTPPPVQIVNLAAINVGVNVTVNQPVTVVVAQFAAINFNITTCCCDYWGTLINWGDGLPAAPGVVAAGPADEDGDPTFYVTGTHTFDQPGNFDISVTVSASGVTPVTTATPATIAVFGEPLDAESAPISGTQGDPLPSSTVVATFIDPLPVSDPATFAQSTQVTVDWGDGTSDDDAVVTPVQGSSVNAGTVFVVTDSHTVPEHHRRVPGFPSHRFDPAAG